MDKSGKDKMLKAYCNACKKTYLVNTKEYCPFCDATNVIINGVEKMGKAKYSIDDFEGLTTQERTLKVLVAMANELHNLYTLLWEIKENLNASSPEK